MGLFPFLGKKEEVQPTLANVLDLAGAVAQQGQAANQINQFANRAAVQVAPQAKQKAIAPMVKREIQQLPDEVKKYHQSIDNWQKENLQRLKDSTELSDDDKARGEAVLWQEAQKYKQQAVKMGIAYNEDRSQNPNLNQLDVAKSNLALRKQGGWKAQTEDQKNYEGTIDAAANPINRFMGDTGSGLEKFGREAFTAVTTPFRVQNLQESKLYRVNQDLKRPDLTDKERRILLIDKQQMEQALAGKPSIQQQNKALLDEPTSYQRILNAAVGQDVSKGIQDTAAAKTGQFVGKEILPFIAAPESKFLEGAGIVEKVGLGIEKGLGKLGVSGGVAKALGKIGAQSVKGTESFASQEVLPAALQEGSKVATGEQTGGQALGNIGKRVATAGAIGAVGAPLLETGLPYVAGKVGQGIANVVEPLQRGNQYKQVLAERAGVQAERVARNADIEQVQAGLQELNIRKAVEDATPTFQSRLAQKTEKAAQKDIQSTVKEAEQRVSTNTAFERKKIEDNIKKTGDLKYLDSFQDAVYQTGDQNLIAKYENKKSRIITEQEGLIANEAKKRQIEEQRQVQALAKEEQNQIKPYLDPVNRAGNKERLASYQNAIKDLDLTPNQKNILENAVKNRAEYLAKREQLTASYKPSPKKAQATEQIKIAQQDLKNQYSEVLNKETAISEKPVRDGLEELGFEVKTNAKGEKFAQLGNVKVSLKNIPPPYSLSGLKSSLKERIASAKAAKDIQTGKVSDIEWVRSEFLDDAQASKYLDELDGESLYQEKQFVDSIKNAQSPQELEAIAAKQPDLFNYDEKGNPSKYMKEYEAREAQLDSPTIRDSQTVETAPKPDVGIPTSNTKDLIQRPELQDGLTKERGFVQTISDNPRIEPEIKAGLKDRTYTPLANKTIVEEAGRIVGEDADEAYKTLMRKDSKLLDAQDIATSRELMSKLQKAGRYDEAIDLADKLAESGTTAGQKIQAYKLYGELDPEGSILKAQRRAEKAMNPKQAEILKKKSNEIIEEVNVLKRKANKEFFDELDGFCGFDGGGL